MITFFILSFISIAAALGIIIGRSPVSSALCLLISILGVALHFLLLDNVLLAAVTTIVYGGAVATLFIFIVMLIDVRSDGRLARAKERRSFLPTIICFSLVVVGILHFALRLGKTPTTDSLPEGGSASLAAYGQQLFTTYLLPVQVIGFLLLIAMIGVIVISKKYDPNATRQKPPTL